jgi:hypothetical protein
MELIKVDLGLKKSFCPICKDLPQVFNLNELGMEPNTKCPDGAFQVQCSCGLAAGDELDAFFSTQDQAIIAWNRLVVKLQKVIEEGE